MKEIEVVPGSNLESVVYTLLAAKARHESAFCVFSGCKLISDTISMDSAYMEVYGVSKAEFDKGQQDIQRQLIEKEEKAKNNIPNWIEKGKALIFPERHAEWERCVNIRAKDLYHGMDLDDSLEILEALENGASIEEAKEIFKKQGHSGMSQSVVRSIILTFSSRGPEFYEATAYDKLSPSEQEILEAKKQENEQHKRATGVNNEVVKENEEDFDLTDDEIRAKNNIPNWIEKGKALIFPERHAEWVECVNARAKDLYHGMDLDASLEILESLENGASIEEAKEIFYKQGHSGFSASMVRRIIFAFSSRGPEFYEATAYDKLSPSEQEILEAKKQENEQLKRATGVNNEVVKENEEDLTDDEIRAKNNIPNWIEKGKALIFPERHAEWVECVNARAKDLYHGMDLDASLEILEALENGASIEEVKEIFDKQGHSGLSASMVRRIIFAFSSRGPEFYEATAYDKLSPNEQEILEAKKQENEQLKRANGQNQGAPKM